MQKENTYTKPLVITHQSIIFETAQSWNPGLGNDNHPGTGNGGSNWPNSNPNVIPDGAGTPGNGKGVGQSKKH